MASKSFTMQLNMPYAYNIPSDLKSSDCVIFHKDFVQCKVKSNQYHRKTCGSGQNS